MNTDEPAFSRGTGILLVLEGLLFIAVALIAHPGVLSGLFSLEIDSMESMQVRYLQLGFGCIGILTLAWGFYEVVLGKPGPLVLLSILCLLPLVVPFGFLGYGSDPDAWAVSFTALKMQATGDYLMSRPPGFPLFEYLATAVVPGAGWPGLFVANLVAGIAGVLLWFLLPRGEGISRVPLLAMTIAVHPLYLLGMATGLDYIWQTLFVSASLVLLVRGLDDEDYPNFGLLIASGISLGLATGFRITSLSVLPVLVALIFFAIPRFMPALESIVVYLFVSIATALVCELPVLLNFGLNALSIQPDPVDPVIIAYRLLRFVLPPPLILAVVFGLVFLIPRWRSLDRTAQLLIGAAVGSLVIILPAFFLLPREPGYLTLCVPFFAILFAFTSPRMLASLILPMIAIWGFLSIPIVSPYPKSGVETSYKPEFGPLVEEARSRFENLRRAQQLLLIEPNDPTAVIVAFDWATLATLRPEWEIENGVLENPNFPVRYYDWIDPGTLEELKAEAFQLVVVEGTERFTKAKYGYDLMEEGATHWNPTKRYYRP